MRLAYDLEDAGFPVLIPWRPAFPVITTAEFERPSCTGEFVDSRPCNDP